MVLFPSEMLFAQPLQLLGTTSWQCIDQLQFLNNLSALIILQNKQQAKICFAYFPIYNAN